MTSVNTTTNHRIDRERGYARESIRERERDHPREREHPRARERERESIRKREREHKPTRQLASQTTYLQDCGGDKGRERSREKEDVVHHRHRITKIWCLILSSNLSYSTVPYCTICTLQYQLLAGGWWCWLDSLETAPIDLLCSVVKRHSNIQYKLRHND
jgi:hypothetical protein